jgi:hypothetical protein
MAWRGHGRGVLRGRVGRRRKGTRYPAGARREVAARASSTSRSAFLRGCGGASMARKKGKSRMGLLVWNSQSAWAVPSPDRHGADLGHQDRVALWHASRPRPPDTLHHHIMRTLTTRRAHYFLNSSVLLPWV